MKTNSNALLGVLVLLTIVIVTIVTFSLGCAETPAIPENTTEIESNSEYVYGNAVVEQTDVLILESFPVQVHVSVTGYLPDGCTQLDEELIKFNNEDNSFTVNLTTRRPADELCTETIVPFQSTVILDVYGLEKGTYKVDVNGIKGHFELQTDNIIPE
ncbi:hypothetical protein [Methanolobus sp.]|uniref:hypothetical protein n=1 Tax=Methanolobus sp. TaxID=1874737 RepID=UPI0025F4F58F|nr:hypothetical protein [Methanolobus sp.]